MLLDGGDYGFGLGRESSGGLASRLVIGVVYRGLDYLIALFLEFVRDSPLRVGTAHRLVNCRSDGCKGHSLLRTVCLETGYYCFGKSCHLLMLCLTSAH